MAEFESLELNGGTWHGVLRGDAPLGRLILVHLGDRVAEAQVVPIDPTSWRVAVTLPLDRLSDGVQSFLLMRDGGKDLDPPQPDARHLGSLTLAAGQVLEYDLLNELALLRSEVDLLKKELRRLASRP